MTAYDSRKEEWKPVTDQGQSEQDVDDIMKPFEIAFFKKWRRQKDMPCMYKKETDSLFLCNRAVSPIFWKEINPPYTVAEIQRKKLAYDKNKSCFSIARIRINMNIFKN